jgi:hypothetical protein
VTERITTIGRGGCTVAVGQMYGTPLRLGA